ncbi:MAG TPA: hypothetical protein VN688_28085 [Gemmataceae bacterium]|nr:hypothetical protein [Gemmataceae bacterium]
MADYFLCLDAETFTRQIRPALAASWRQRSFAPCRDLCAALLPAAREYTARYHTGDDETLVSQVPHGLSFDRACWRLLVGEVLLFAAIEIPEFQSNAETLCCLLAPDKYRSEATNREHFASIQQVLWGSRDLTFGSAAYRPEQAGYNDPDDVARLAAYLATIRPESWTVDELCELRAAEDEEERADELAFVREWFPVLVELYQRVQARNQVLVIESIY